MKICIVDDDQLVSLSLKTILEVDGDIEILGMGTDGADAVRLYETDRPDVLLMDIRMKQMSGLDAAKKILEQDPQAKILLLTTFSDDEYIVKALHIGVKGYILKQDFESIAPALKAVYNGQTVFGDVVTTKLVTKLPEPGESAEAADSTHYPITEKERRIIERVADGLNNKEIAGELFLSEGTVRNYLSQILEKLGLRDRTQLAIFYYREMCALSERPDRRNIDQ